MATPLEALGGGGINTPQISTGPQMSWIGDAWRWVDRNIIDPLTGGGAPQFPQIPQAPRPTPVSCIGGNCGGSGAQMPVPYVPGGNIPWVPVPQPQAPSMDDLRRYFDAWMRDGFYGLGSELMNPNQPPGSQLPVPQQPQQLPAGLVCNYADPYGRAIVRPVQTVTRAKAPKGYVTVTDPRTGQRVAMLREVAIKLKLYKPRRKAYISAADMKALNRAERTKRKITTAAKKADFVCRKKR